MLHMMHISNRLRLTHLAHVARLAAILDLDATPSEVRNTGVGPFPAPDGKCAFFPALTRHAC
jgi:hypothetical protein